jgi:hypothetical protein
MTFRHFTTAQWNALPPERKVQEKRTRTLGGKEVTRLVKFYVPEHGPMVVAIVSDNPIIEGREI